MSVTDFVVAVLLPPLASAGWQVVFRLMRWTFPVGLRYFIQGWITSAAVGIGFGSVQHYWAWMGGSAVSLAAAVLFWWWRKNRAKVKALLGAKSKALRDALAARMPRPRPVLVPGGAS